jgi:hypothetical protein
MPTEIKIISHSNVFYWWPAWVVGFAVALISFVQGREIAIEPGIVERVHPSNNPGIFFIAVVVMLVVFTTTKLRGIYLSSPFSRLHFSWSYSRGSGGGTTFCDLSPICRHARTWAFT